MRRTALYDQYPAVSASLLMGGQVTTQTSLFGEGSPELHPAVLAFVNRLPEEVRRGFSGNCAEIGLISDRLWMLDEQRADGRTSTIEEVAAGFEGAALAPRKVREPGNPEHGKFAPPCPVCSALIDRLNIRLIGA